MKVEFYEDFAFAPIELKVGWSVNTFTIFKSLVWQKL